MTYWVEKWTGTILEDLWADFIYIPVALLGSNYKVRALYISSSLRTNESSWFKWDGILVQSGSGEGEVKTEWKYWLDILALDSSLLAGVVSR